MLDEERDQQIARVLKAARSVPRPGVQERAIAAMEACRPRPVRIRAGVVAVAAAAVAVLIGLGFVPLPAGSAKGAFSRALAMTAQCPGMHVTGRIWGPVGEWRFEQWFTRDGFRRLDLADGDQVVQRWLYDPGERAIVPRVRETEPLLRAVRGGVPLYGDGRLSVPVIGPDAPVEIGYREDVVPYPLVRDDYRGKEPTIQDFWQRLEDHHDALEVKVEEHQRYSLWGGRVAVADVYGHLRSGAHVRQLTLGNVSGPIYTSLGPGDDVWIHVETEPETNAILALQQYWRVGDDDKWKLVYCVDSIEFGAEMGEQVRDPGLPEHHIEVEDSWWRDRLPRVLAVGESEGWQVTLHSLEANREGDLFLTLSRQPRTKVTQNTFYEEGRPAPPTRTLSLEVVDNFGTRYTTAPALRGRLPSLPRVWGDAFEERWPPTVLGEPESRMRVHLVPRSEVVRGRVPRAASICITNEPTKSIPELTGVTSVPSDDYDAFATWFRETYYQTITFTALPVPRPQGTGDLIEDAIRTTER